MVKIMKEGKEDTPIVTPARMLGVCKTAHLQLDLYPGSLPYTPNYDDLPLVVKMWLTTKNWEAIKALAESLNCEEVIFYSDIEYVDDDPNDKSVYVFSSLPLVICDESNAVLLAPREIRSNAFTVEHEDFCKTRILKLRV